MNQTPKKFQNNNERLNQNHSELNENNSQQNQNNPQLNNNNNNNNFIPPSFNNFGNNPFIPPAQYLSEINNNNIRRPNLNQNIPYVNIPNINPNPNFSYINSNQNNHPQMPNLNQREQPSSIFRNGNVSYDENTSFYSDQSGIYSFGFPTNYNNNYNNRIRENIPQPLINESFPNSFNNQSNINSRIPQPHGPLLPYIPPSPYIVNNRLNNLPSSIRIRPRISHNEERMMIKEQLNEIEINEDFLNKNTIKECIICLEEFKVGDKICYLPCFHFFHSDCIKKWIDESKKCPVCNNCINLN